MPSCPANAIPEVQNAVNNAGGYIAQKNHGAGVHEALLHFTNGAIVAAVSECRLGNNTHQRTLLDPIAPGA